MIKAELSYNPYIKETNTNTKIILRTPEANDREAVGRSMGLTEERVIEIAKLPRAVGRKRCKCVGMTTSQHTTACSICWISISNTA